MGIFSEYLAQAPTLNLAAERKQQLKRISEIRRRDILVYASDFNKGRQAPINIDHSDLLPIIDQLSNLKSKSIDLLLLTCGGSGEAAEDIVRLLYERFESVAFIIPGMAKSAGTIMVMAGDEILMEASSSLGPIDAQIQWEGKSFSAEAFLKGLENIKNDAAVTLNKAYVPILHRISPGEIQNAQNALDFAKVLVTQWLKEHKFKNWKLHRTHNPDTPVTGEEREARAKEIADKLCDHSKWLSHGRSIKIPDLQELGLEITDYSKNQELADAIRRYHVLLQMTFDQSTLFKLYETPGSQMQRMIAPIVTAPPGVMAQVPGSQSPLPNRTSVNNVAPAGALINFQCSKCGNMHQIQVDFDQKRQLQANAISYPSDDLLSCRRCGTRQSLLPIRKQIESQTGRRVAK